MCIISGVREGKWWIPDEKLARVPKMVAKKKRNETKKLKNLVTQKRKILDHAPLKWVVLDIVVYPECSSKIVDDISFIVIYLCGISEGQSEIFILEVFLAIKIKIYIVVF